MPNSDPTNGGRRINNLEQKDAVQDVKIDILVKQSGEIHNMLSDALPKIIRNEACIQSNKDWIRAIWAVLIALSVVAIKAAFF